jgi:hypothetical protein
LSAPKPENDDHGQRWGELAEAAEGLGAVEAGHADVEEDEADAGSGSSRKRARPTTPSSAMCTE